MNSDFTATAGNTGMKESIHYWTQESLKHNCGLISGLLHDFKHVTIFFFLCASFTLIFSKSGVVLSVILRLFQQIITLSLII